MKKHIVVVLGGMFVPNVVFAHCPLCVAGAGALAVLAASFGVSSVVVGVCIGAFSVALGLWLGGIVKKEYIRGQKLLVAIAIYLGTVIPIMPLIRHYGPLYVPFIGEYGTTYTIDLYILGVGIGSAIMVVAPYISKGITRLRGVQVPFQGIMVTLLLLLITSLIIQLS